MIKVLVLFGTRPEAIKLCPVVTHLRSRPAEFNVRVCVTAQHRGMLDQVLAAFRVEPDDDLDVMLPAQNLASLTARVVSSLDPVIAAYGPDMVLVQGDTTTTFSGALAAFYRRVAVGHVEAGLRTWDMQHPFPEEMNRVLTTRMSALHFAPTERSAENLRREGVQDDAITVTGNSGIDAVLSVRDALAAGQLPRGTWPFLDPMRKLVLVTAHRRESFGAGFDRICNALLRIARAHDVQIVYPVHRNPNVQDPVNRLLNGARNIFLIEPLDYVAFVDLMERAHFLLTDSGGVQEEGPSLGKPILVMREKTERPEAVEAGTVKLVGTDEDRICAAAAELLTDTAEYQRMSRVHNPYGDGHASKRIADMMLDWFSRTGSAAATSAA